MQNIDDILKNFSFSKAESTLYVANLRLGKASIAEIAEKAGMGRTVAYFHIKNLLKKRVLQQTKKGNKLFIVPTAPAELAKRLQKEINNFKTLIPQLDVLANAENAMPIIEIEESNIAFKKIYDEVIYLPAGSVFKVIEDKAGAEAELKLLENEYWNFFFTQMVERKIITKAIFTKELLYNINNATTPQNYKLLKNRLWNIRVLPEAMMPIKNLVILYNHKLSFLFPDISLTITIKHPALFKLIDTLFETIFAFGEKVDNPWCFNKLT